MPMPSRRRATAEIVAALAAARCRADGRGDRARRRRCRAGVEPEPGDPGPGDGDRGDRGTIDASIDRFDRSPSRPVAEPIAASVTEPTAAMPVPIPNRAPAPMPIAASIPEPRPRRRCRSRAQSTSRRQCRSRLTPRTRSSRSRRRCPILKPTADDRGVDLAEAAAASDADRGIDPDAEPQPPIAASIEPPSRSAPIELPRVDAPQPPPHPDPGVVLPMTRTVRIEVPPRTSTARARPSGIDRLLRIAAARGASALFLTSESRPWIRVEGDLRYLDSEAPLSRADVESAILEIAPESGHESIGRGRGHRVDRRVRRASAASAAPRSPTIAVPACCCG